MNQNDNSGCSSIFVVILGIVLFIIGPIVTTISVIVSVPVGIKVFYFLWLLFCLAIYTFIADGKTAFGICCIPTLIYGIVHASWYAEYELEGYYGGGGLGDTIGIALMPFAILLPMYFIGSFLRKKYTERKQAKIGTKIKLLQESIKQHKNSIVALENKIAKKHRTINVLQLVRMCGGATTIIESNQEVANMHLVIDEIKKHKEAIIQLQQTIKDYESLK